MDGFLKPIIPLVLCGLSWATPQVTIEKGGYSYHNPYSDTGDGLHATKDHLETIPGAFLKKSGGWGSISTLMLRGLSAHHTLVTLDGVPVRDALNITDLSSFLSGSTEIDHLTQGSPGVMHGAGGTGGLLALKTPQHKQNQYTIMGGSHQTAYVHTALTKNTDTTHITVHTDVMNTAGLPQRKQKKYGQNSHNQQGTVAGNLTHVQGANAYNLTARRTAGYSRYFSTLSTPKPQNRQSQNFSFLQGNMQHHGLNAHHFIQGFYVGSTLKGTGAPGSHITSKGLNYKYHHKTNQWFLRGLTGAAWDTFQRDVTEKKNRPQGYAGALLGYYITNHVTAEVGARFNYQKSFGSLWTYSAGVSWSDDHTQLSTHIRTGFLNPSLFDLYVNGPYSQANANLKPETSRTVDLSLKHKIKSNLWFMARPYLSRFHNMMKTQSIPQGKFQKQNIKGNSYVSGIETGLTHNVTDKVGYTLSYAHTRYNLNAANTNTEFPENKLSFTTTYMPTERSKFTLIGHSVGQRRSQNHCLRAYNVLHIRADYAVRPRMNLFARIENLFDTRYETIHNFETEGQSFYVGLHIQH